MRMRMWKKVVPAVAVVVACAAPALGQGRLNGFNVMLLLGETKSGTPGDGPEGAWSLTLGPSANPALRKALSDVKDFLPYKTYRVLDTQWLRQGSTRMKGLDEQEYSVSVGGDEYRPILPAEGPLHVAFGLSEVGAPTNASEEYARTVQVTDMLNEIASIRVRVAESPGASPTNERFKVRVAQLEKQIRLARARQLIDARFEMTPGETIVVGTSKIGGDKGLIVLLTAVAAGGK
jgi:hypothetical protein